MGLALAIEGSGDPVVFLHGCPTFPDVLHPIARAVARTRRAIEVALPGYGASAPLSAPWHIDDLHDAVEAAVRTESRGSPVTIVGFSAGGYHALALATRGVLAMKSVVCLGGYMSLDQAEREGFRAFAEMLRKGSDLRAIAGPRFLSPAFGARHPDAVAEVTAWLEATPAANLANELGALAVAPDLTGGVSALRIPIRARVGALDLAVPPAKSEALVAAAHDGLLEVVPGAGHALMYEDLEATTSWVIQSIG